MTRQVQKRNAQMADLLRQDFQHRREPNYAWSRAVSMCLALPGLRAFWPMSRTCFTVAQRAPDISGGILANDLAANNVPVFGYDSLAPYVEFDGANQYLSRADGGVGNWADITGTEAYIVAVQRGMTLGGWFYFNNAAGANAETLANKWDASINQRAYDLVRRDAAGGGVIRAKVSLNGAAVTTVDSVTAPAQATWTFIVMRFIPSTTLSVFVDNERSDNAVGIPASIVDSTAQFNIGASSPAPFVNFFDGRASVVFLCAAQLSDAIILSLYEQTRAMYGI